MGSWSRSLAGRGPLGCLGGLESVRSRIPWHSLRFKVTVGTLLPLLVILALSSYLQYLRHRDLMLQELRRTASNSAKIVEASLGHAMLANDRMEMQRAVSRIGAQREVSKIFLLSKEGKIAFSTLPKEVGTVLDIKDRTCQVCHKKPQASQTGALVITDDSGKRVLRSVSSINKSPPCFACHERTDATYGVLIMDFSMDDVEMQLARERRDTILWALGALLLLAVAINTILRQVVIRPLERLTEAVRRVGRGELGYRTGLGGNDSIGELSRTFDQMAEGLEGKALVAAENARLYEELQRKEALRGQLIEQLWTVQEEERRRISRELHDHTSQALTTLLVGLKMLAEGQDTEQIRERVAELRAIAAHTLEGVHDLAVQLRPSVLDDMGLVAATQHTATNFAGHFGIQVHFQAVGFDDRRLSPAVETTIYRIVQEALTNVAKHARAQNVDILLEYRGDVVLALVEDDGQGFDVEATLQRPKSGRLGLFGMQERAALVGGTLTVESSAGGTTVLVEIPLSPADHSPSAARGQPSEESEQKPW